MRQKSQKITLILLFVSMIVSLPGFAQKDNTASDKVEYYLRQARNEKQSFQARIEFYNHALNLKNGEEQTLILCEKAQLFEDNGKYNLEIQTLNEALTVTDKDSHLFPKILIMRIRANYYSGLYLQILNDAFTVIDMNVVDSLAYRQTEAWLLLSEAFGSLQNLDLSEKCLKKASESFTSYQNTNVVNAENIRKVKLKLHGNSMNIQMAKCDYNSALKELKIIENLAVTPHEKALAKASMTMVYQDLGEDVEASDYYPDLMLSALTPMNKGIAAIHYLTTLVKQRRFKEAEKIANTYQWELSLLKSRPQMGAHLQLLKSEIAKNNGNMEDAMRYQYNAYAHMDSLFKSQSSLMSQDITMRFEQWMNQHKLQKVNNEKEKTLWFIALLAITLVIVLIFSFVILRKHKAKTKETQNVEKSLNDARENHEKEIELKNISLFEKDNKLGYMAMHLSEINQCLAQIKKISMQTHYTDKENLKQIKQVVKQISLQDNLWKIYNKYFEEANSHFFDKLYKVQPSLTKSEVRMCAYILMNLSSKEIANFTGRSVRTVQTIKANIRKKMHITESTEEYIRQISLATDSELEKFRDRCCVASDCI